MYSRLPSDMTLWVSVWLCLYDYIALSRTCMEAWRLSLQKKVGVHVTYSDNKRARRDREGNKRVPVEWWRELTTRHRVSSVWCTYWQSTRSHPQPQPLIRDEDDNKAREARYCYGNAYQWTTSKNPRLSEMTITFKSSAPHMTGDKVLELPLFPSALHRLRLRLNGRWRWESLLQLTCLLHLSAYMSNLSDCRYLPPTLVECSLRTGGRVFRTEFEREEVTEAWRCISRLPRLCKVSTDWCTSPSQIVTLFSDNVLPLPWETLEIHLVGSSYVTPSGEEKKKVEKVYNVIFPRLRQLRLHDVQHCTPRDWMWWKRNSPELSSLDLSAFYTSFLLLEGKRIDMRQKLVKECLPIGDWPSLRRFVLRYDADVFFDADPSALPWKSLTSLHMHGFSRPTLRLPVHAPSLGCITHLSISPGHKTPLRLATTHFAHLTHLKLYLFEREPLLQVREFIRLASLDLTFGWECTDAEMSVLGESLPATTLQHLRLDVSWRLIRATTTWTTLFERLRSLTDLTLHCPRIQSPPIAMVATPLKRGCRVHWFHRFE